VAGQWTLSPQQLYTLGDVETIESVIHSMKTQVDFSHVLMSLIEIITI